MKGANDCVDEACIDSAWETIRSCDMILLQHEIPLATNGYVIRRAAGRLKVLLNPAPFEEVPADILEKAAYVTPNEHEAALMFPGMSREEILSAPACTVLMTIGKDGVAFGGENGPETVPGFQVPVVDTTGAGDTFNGAFAEAAGEDAPPGCRPVCQCGSGAFHRKIGAQGGMPRRGEVEELLKCRK